MPQSADRAGLVIAAAAASGLGLAVAVSRFAYEGGTNGLTVASCRAVVGVLVLFAFCQLTCRRIRIPFRDWAHSAGLGVLMSLMYYGNVGSVEFISIGLAALLFYTYPPIVAVIVALVVRETVGPAKIAGLVVAFSGLALMLGGSLGVSDGRGVALALGASGACAWNAVWLARKVAHLDSAVVTLHMALVAAPILLVVTAASGGVDWPDSTAGWGGLAGVVALQCAAMPFYFFAIPRIGALRSAMISNVQPVVSIVAAYALFAEAVTPVQFAGGALVLGGIGVAQWRDSVASRRRARRLSGRPDANAAHGEGLAFDRHRSPIMKQTVVLSAADNVATSLSALQAGANVTVDVGGDPRTITIRDDIAFGHKFAIVAMERGAPVLKYGEVIGLASQPIAPGEWVHVHNIESARARGDLNATGPAAGKQP